MSKKQIVVGFEIDLNNDISYNTLSDRQLHEIALSDENACIYDCVKDFFAELNADLVDVENHLWFVVNID